MHIIDESQIDFLSEKIYLSKTQINTQIRVDSFVIVYAILLCF